MMVLNIVEVIYYFHSVKYLNHHGHGTTIILSVLMAVNLIYFLIHETPQIRHFRWGYYREYDNSLDLVQLVLTVWMLFNHVFSDFWHEEEGGELDDYLWTAHLNKNYSVNS